MDTDRVGAVHLDVDLVGEVDVHVMRVPAVATEPLSDARAGRRFQPHPFDEGAGNMQQSHVTYSSKIMGGAAAHG